MDEQIACAQKSDEVEEMRLLVGRVKVLVGKQQARRKGVVGETRLRCCSRLFAGSVKAVADAYLVLQMKRLP